MRPLVDIRQKFGDAVRTLRRLQNVTLRQLVARSGLTMGRVRAIEVGRGRLVRSEIEQLIAALPGAGQAAQDAGGPAPPAGGASQGAEGLASARPAADHLFGGSSRARAGHSPALVRVPVVAEFLGVSRTTVFALIMSGSLRSVLLGRSRRVPREELGRVLQHGLPQARKRLPKPQEVAHAQLQLEE